MDKMKTLINWIQLEVPFTYYRAAENIARWFFHKLRDLAAAERKGMANMPSEEANDIQYATTQHLAMKQRDSGCNRRVSRRWRMF